ncbi:MAG: YidC/Oxa1 family membrane protein insertase [Chloroflexota bacterium]
MGEIFNWAIVQPSTSLLEFLFGIFGSYGIAIIVFTAIIRVVLLPLTLQQLRSAKAMQELQPQIQALQKKYAKDKEKQTQETMKLYKEAKVNPAMGCLPLLVQLPILFGLYQALLNLSHTPAFKQPFLWLQDLSAPESFPYILIILMTASQFVYQRMATPRTTDPQQQATNQIMQFTPLLFAFLFINFPSGLVLYWVATNVFSIIQQYFITGWGSLLPAKEEKKADGKRRGQR